MNFIIIESLIVFCYLLFIITVNSLIFWTITIIFKADKGWIKSIYLSLITTIFSGTLILLSPWGLLTFFDGGPLSGKFWTFSILRVSLFLLPILLVKRVYNQKWIKSTLIVSFSALANYIIIVVFAIIGFLIILSIGFRNFP